MWFGSELLQSEPLTVLNSRMLQILLASMDNAAEMFPWFSL